MYDELVKQLRELPHLLFVQLGDYEKIVYQAADAIEELLRDNKMLHAYRDVCAGLSPEEVQKKLFFQDLTTAHILEQYIPLFIPKWISVKGIDPLPKEGQKVLVFAQRKDSEPVMDIATFSLYKGVMDFGWKSEASYFWYDSDEVTHWMPLPEPPKED